MALERADALRERVVAEERETALKERKKVALRLPSTRNAKP